ncbi:MAG: ribose-5-phosphate isomerase RpiA [Neomegalonema sp.]|nr:ribose-5-phosphate isomerase RpiA [Neomegalonema sp.]
MSATPSPADLAKRAAAEAALEYVQDGMKLGLGSGSTAAAFVSALGEARPGRFENVVCVPTSLETGRLAERAGLPLATLDSLGWLDLTVDGADEIDPELNLVKGGGGALLVEKIVASASDQMVVIADDSKLVKSLGAFPLPVEITPFGWETTRAVVELLVAGYDVDGVESSLRMKGDTPFITDEGNMILDLKLGRIGEPADLGFALNSIPGVVENGLFISIADVAICADATGAKTVLERPESEEISAQ